ncbi:BZ3500_MvSof-1268-A1-R1_Chr1-1g00904 [Microbotryum saponariae]|uniref:BZ3500_MvSof-1268-A1-R1_Chr1-1g00904 protein n=1 Tax=Microbotryum saponariae TaxID=289078 RepID=A0A2X0L2H9_9BASI|nr:BZ3500_MvSof-1268-A1-R1_Chr1-1g00904 [Microbotryum saponariae]SCZ92901.1 BZ3501_MvSof-1269-A2-R1_Chr1-1g00501 [Microbotryum saponariae]
MTSTSNTAEHSLRLVDRLCQLRAVPPHLPLFTVDSTKLEPSSLPYHYAGTPREYHLSQPSSSHAGPIIAASPWVPPPMIPHLMRNKRDSAIATKYLPGTAVTNMEAMLHTFVTAILPIEMFGDYQYDPQGIGHDVPYFETMPSSQSRAPANRGRLTRKVLLSTQIHLDFEDWAVALEFFASPQGSESAALLGQSLDLDWSVLTSDEKADNATRALYDQTIRRHAIHHLLENGKLIPDCEETWRSIGHPWSVADTISNLEGILRSSTIPPPTLINHYVVVPVSGSGRRTLSMEFLLNTYISTLVNELSVLEACGSAYVYTYDPPSIFARQLGLPDGPRLLNLVWTLALLHVIVRNQDGGRGLTYMKVLAFNDYAHLGIVEMLDQALRGAGKVTPKVVKRSQLFGSDRGRLDTRLLAQLVPPLLGQELRLALVIHNNSDAFGQNIETESRGGSMDGAIGERSSAAAGLRRDRKNLFESVV